MRMMNMGLKVLSQSEYIQDIFYNMIVNAIVEREDEFEDTKAFINDFNKIIIPKSLRYKAELQNFKS
jgi:hypothetical protein